MLSVQICVVLFTLILLLMTYQRNFNLTLDTQIDRIIFISITICLLLAISNASVNLFFCVYALLTSLYITIPLSSIVLKNNDKIRPNYIYLWLYIFSLYILFPLIEVSALIYVNLGILFVLFLFGSLSIYKKFNTHTHVFTLLFLAHSITILFFNITVLLWIMLAEMVLAYIFHFSRMFRIEGPFISFLERHKIGMYHISTALTENSIYSVIIMDRNLKVVYANPYVMTMTGYNREEIVGNSFKMFRSQQTPDAIYDSLDVALEAGYEWTGIVENEKKDGTRYWEELFISPIKKGERTIGFISIRHDESVDINQRKQLEFEANYDELTGVMRRRKFIEMILDDEESGESTESKFLIMADLNRFKEINDQFGHDIGDKVLIIVAHFIRESFGRYGIVSRYGGDEFLIYVKGLSQGDIDQKLYDIKTLISEYSFASIIPDADIELSLSTGYAEMRQGYEETFKQADLRMYQDKNG